jgi:type IV secretion system protein TrbI
MIDAPTPTDTGAITAPLTGGNAMPGEAALSTRAKPGKTQRINPGAVRLAYLVAAGVLSSAFVFAFVVAPSWRAEARAKAAAENQRTPPGSVRPADVLSDGPVSYADLTKPEELAPVAEEPVPEAPPPRPAAGPAHAPRVIVRREPSTPRETRVIERAAHAPREPRGPSEAEKARLSSLFFAGAPTAQVAAVTTPSPDTGPARIARREDHDAVYGDRAVLAPLSPYELKAGTVIPAALLTAVDTEREGRVLASVTENVFDTVTGELLLIPQGARLIGRFDGDQTYGERRAFLVWERLIWPDGRSLTLNREPGVDSAGAGGIPGRVDRRIPQLLAATLFAGAITTLGEAARRDGEDKEGSLLGDAGDAAAIEAARIGGRLVDREMEVKPTIRVRQGTRVQVLLTRDLILEPLP